MNTMWLFLPFKPKERVMCHHHPTLEDSIGIREAYMSAKAGIYLIKNLKRRLPGPNTARTSKRESEEYHPSYRQKGGTVPR